jgi:hypothetical protein
MEGKQRNNHKFVKNLSGGYGDILSKRRPSGRGVEGLTYPRYPTCEPKKRFRNLFDVSQASESFFDLVSFLLIEGNG